MSAPARDYIALNEAAIRRGSEHVERTSRQLIIGLLALGLAGGVAGVMTGYGAARVIGSRLLKLSFPLQLVAGRLDQVAGSVTMPLDPRVEGLEEILQKVAERVSEVVEQLEVSQRDALRAEQLAALGQLAAGLSHELRNPLMAITAILGEPDVASDLDDRDIIVLREEAMRLESLVQSLLDFARPNDPEPRAIDLHRLLDTVVHLVGARAESRGVEITFDRVPDGTNALTDQGHLRQILLNLLLNAVDATPHNGKINVGVQPHGDLMAITIRNEGKGVPRHLGERIFEPFVSDKETGIGLGLSISRRLAELNGGSLVAASTDEGAVFTLSLPTASPRVPERRERVGA